MSDTKKHEYTNWRVKNRGNPLGICMCLQCRYGRKRRGAGILSLKHKYRNSWKNGRRFKKGIYTD